MRFNDAAFIAAGRPASWLGWVLLLVGALTSAAAMNRWLNERDQLEIAQTRLSNRVALMPPERAAKPRIEITPEMEAQAREQRSIETALNRDWPGLFARLERTLGADIALLTVQPDARRGTFVVTGEARNVAALIAYEQRLDRQFGDVVLSTHEVQEMHPHKPVKFSMSARWGQGESS